MRTDAMRNQSAVLDAAEEMFAEHGLAVSLNEIARRAGVGNATLYRHFPRREDLIDTVFARQMEQYCRIAEDAVVMPEPGEAFRACVTATCGLQAGNRGLADLLASSAPLTPQIDALRAREYAAITTVIDRAVAAGAARRDLRPADFAILLIANAGLIRRTVDDAPGASARLVALWLDGATVSETAAPPPPTEEETAAALRRP